MRFRDPAGVVDEMEYWYKLGYRQFSFLDDNFNASRKRVYAICDEIRSRGLRDLFLRCLGARADKLDNHMLKKMKEAGFKTVAIGVEVGNDKMLAVIRKGEKFEDIDRAVKEACNLGYDVYLNFLAGVPYETLSDIADSINFAQKYPIFYAAWSNIIPYPGTELYDWLSQKNYLLKEPDEYLNDDSDDSDIPVFMTPELSFDTRRKILRHLKHVTQNILRRGILLRLEQHGVKWGLRHIISYLASHDTLSKFLFQNPIRRLADSIRFRLYMKSGRAKSRMPSSSA